MNYHHTFQGPVPQKPISAKPGLIFNSMFLFFTFYSLAWAGILRLRYWFTGKSEHRPRTLLVKKLSFELCFNPDLKYLWSMENVPMNFLRKFVACYVYVLKWPKKHHKHFMLIGILRNLAQSPINSSCLATVFESSTIISFIKLKFSFSIKYIQTLFINNRLLLY